MDGVDRISDLPDDLLHVILSFVREAPSVTATAALSRRWRHVWTRSGDLLLEDTDVRNLRNNGGNFAGFVDWVLAQRGDADMDSLHIIMFVHQEGCPLSDKISEWVRYGMQHVTGDFRLSIPFPGTEYGTAIELPSHGRAASISLDLSLLGLRLPTMAGYEDLTELVLDDVSFGEDEEGRALCDFVSSCCPRLRRLDIKHPRWLTQLVLRVEALEEIRIYEALQLQALDVTAPNLLVFKLKATFGARVRLIAAPRLQKIDMYISPYPYSSLGLEVHGTTSIRSLGVISLHMHGQYRFKTDDSYWFLRNCPRVEDVKVWLGYLHGGHVMNHVVDATLDCAATFPNVRSMRVRADFTSEHNHFVASVSTLLMRFARLRTLCIELNTRRGISGAKCFCDVLGNWTDHGQLSMEFLEEVKISGFTGAKEEIDVVSLLFKSSQSIKSMSLSAASKTRYATSLKQKKEDDKDEDGQDSLEPIHLKLIDMSSTNRGHWHLGKSIYTWVRYTNKL